MGGGSDPIEGFRRSDADRQIEPCSQLRRIRLARGDQDRAILRCPPFYAAPRKLTDQLFDQLQPAVTTAQKMLDEAREAAPGLLVDRLLGAAPTGEQTVAQAEAAIADNDRPRLAREVLGWNTPASTRARRCAWLSPVQRTPRRRHDPRSCCGRRLAVAGLSWRDADRTARHPARAARPYRLGYRGRGEISLPGRGRRVEWSGLCGRSRPQRLF
jgi:hypothetical protein